MSWNELVCMLETRIRLRKVLVVEMSGYTHWGLVHKMIEALDENRLLATESLQYDDGLCL